ncbi:pyridoxamine 5'-phosphate oxidase family protein [Haladaptatus caseinilyticus]|uniref:pyridoxamine 5'-phosphate oxidase family protein n=1 Tax=Haladaptatus caseinilyticus TaxID=2993314 RepID=UPI00224B9A61|nr:pyridoxamine 5'-phosphate oxidase family protein [Haladaptatus caseinilyticus]
MGDETSGASPRRSRPTTEESYGIPTHEDGMLSWEFVRRKMASDETYWGTTTLPDGRPHARPIWGVWIDDTFYCGGGEKTRWVRNLALRPEIVVHRESGTDVVIIEGTAERIDDETADEELLERLDAAYEGKYGIQHGTPFFAVRPETVLAWSDYPEDATRWSFD